MPDKTASGRIYLAKTFEDKSINSMPDGVRVNHPSASVRCRPSSMTFERSADTACQFWAFPALTTDNFDKLATSKCGEVRT
jgi:hypothetical protein